VFRDTGLLALVEESLAKAGVANLWYSAVDPNPMDSQIDDAARVAGEEGIDVVIGLGGGSAMDAAKGVAVAAGHQRPIWHYADRANRGDLGTQMLPVLAVPTTAGTGSEVTQYIVVTNHQTHEKPGIGSDLTYASTAIVDPEVTATMPRAVAAASGVDVLAHSIEAYASLRSSPLTDLYCEEAFRLVGAHFMAVLVDQPRTEDRAGMSLAAMLAGMAIARCRTTVCHALGHAAGGVANLVHGEILAALMPASFRFSMGARPAKYGRIGGLLAGAGRAEAEEKNDTEASVAAVETILSESGMARTLADLQVDGARHPEIVDGALSYMTGPLEADPADITRDGLLGILADSA
jgi:alcohol dehydrogenase class IV